MKLIKYSQFTFVVENDNGCRLLIDPVKYNYSKDFGPEDFDKVDILVITHKHADHHDEEAEQLIISKNKPALFTNRELVVTPFCKENSFVEKNVGDVIEIDGFRITFMFTDHFAKGEVIENFGLFIECDGKSFYHTSDTRFMEPKVFDLNLVQEADVLTLPISNRGVVMGVDDAVFFTAQIQPGIVIPAHYDSPKDRERVRPEDFVKTLDLLKGRIDGLDDVKVSVMNFGDVLEV